MSAGHDRIALDVRQWWRRWRIGGCPMPPFSTHDAFGGLFGFMATTDSSSQSSRPSDLIRIDPADNVAVTTVALAAGTTVRFDAGKLTLRQPIPAGHKIATQTIGAGDAVVRYGQTMGVAAESIAAGDHVHDHNVGDAAGSTDLRSVRFRGGQSLPKRSRCFDGYVRRTSGVTRYGTRNYVAIVSTVNCSATVAHRVAATVTPDVLAAYPNVDGVFAITHTSGCAMRHDGEKHRTLTRVLRGYLNHPNIGAAMVIGLGCEQSDPTYLSGGVVPITNLDGRELSGDPSARSRGDAIPMTTIQTEGGTAKTIARASQRIPDLLASANLRTRQSIDAAHLIVAMECGGSDAHSGITANPILGGAGDRIIASGGRSVVSETTELSGAEHLLAARCRDRQIAETLYAKLRWWRRHVEHYGGRLDHNPSLGNKAGGLTTITEKSLGAVSKTGRETVADVVDYAAPIATPGLTIMDTPGFDPASVTGKIAGGANVVLFSTGRGSCFGAKPVPVIKVATTTKLFQTMRDDMDFDAGRRLDGVSADALSDELFELTLRVASGQTTASERLGLGDHEFVPWLVGPTL